MSGDWYKNRSILTLLFAVTDVLLALLVVVVVVLLACCVYAKKPALSITQVVEDEIKTQESEIKTLVSMWKD